VSRQRAYTGHSGQMAVMAELLHRQCNVAVPDVDFGTDVFAFHDNHEYVARIQVKTSHGEPYKRGEGYHAQFTLPLKQLDRPDSPPLFYALAVRSDRGWEDFIVIGREKLKDIWNGTARLGKSDAKNENLIIYAQFRSAGVRCGEIDMSAYLNAWDLLPPLWPQAGVATDAGILPAGGP
jgi:hypothetical protein